MLLAYVDPSSMGSIFDVSVDAKHYELQIFNMMHNPVCNQQGNKFTSKKQSHYINEKEVYNARESL